MLDKGPPWHNKAIVRSLLVFTVVYSDHLLTVSLTGFYRDMLGTF